jgi:hypothetical protein
VAAWYLWRAVDLHRAGKLTAPASPTRVKIVKKKQAANKVPAKKGRGKKSQRVVRKPARKK